MQILSALTEYFSHNYVCVYKSCNTTSLHVSPSPGILVGRDPAYWRGRPVSCVLFRSPEPPSGWPAVFLSSPAGNRPPQSPAQHRVTPERCGHEIIYLNQSHSLWFGAQRCVNVVADLHCSSRAEDELIGKHVPQEAETVEDLLCKTIRINMRRNQPMRCRG